MTLSALITTLASVPSLAALAGVMIKAATRLTYAAYVPRLWSVSSLVFLGKYFATLGIILCWAAFRHGVNFIRFDVRNL